MDQFVTYNSGGRVSQIDFFMCRRCHLKVVIHCKMINGEAAAGQLRVLVMDWMKIILKYNSESGKHHEDKRTTYILTGQKGSKESSSNSQGAGRERIVRGVGNTGG